MSQKSLESFSIPHERSERSRLQRDSSTGNTSLDLRSPGLLAKQPLLGFMMFFLGSLVFAFLAYSIQADGPLLRWDIATAKQLNIKALNVPSGLVEYVIFGFFAGREIIVILGTILAIYFLHKKYWRELTMVVVGLGGGALIWYFLSRFFDRPRPTVQMDVILSAPTFPSGHALSAVLGYGLLAYLLVPRMPARFWKWFVAILLILITVFIGFSRLLVGGHYVTDVIAGYAVGIAWAGLAYTLIEKIFWKEDNITGKVEARVPAGAARWQLRSPGVFKKWPMIGFLLILLGGLSFGAISLNVLTQGNLVQLDKSVYSDLFSMARQAPAYVNELMIFGFFLGKQVIEVLFTILTLYFLHHRFWRELEMLVLSSAGGSFVWDIINKYFDRPRPPEQTGLVVTIPSFPSGHAMSVVICYGLLAYLLVPNMPSRFWKWTVSVATLFLILFSGFSRIFQGSHYLTDVLAGYALGIAWAVLVYTILEKSFKEEN